MKVCSRCNLEKPLNEYYNNKRTKSGLDNICILCRKEYNFIGSFNITVSSYKILLARQKNRCAVCGKHSSECDKMLAVDHCHETGKIRGLLCTRCNFSIDHPNTVRSQAMLDYLSQGHDEDIFSAPAEKYNRLGISKEDYLRLHKWQAGKCGICRKPGTRFVVDRDLTTGKPYGLLCRRCGNRFLANPDTMRNMFRYYLITRGLKLAK